MNTVVVIIGIFIFLALLKVLGTGTTPYTSKHDIFLRGQFRALIYNRIGEKPLKIEIPENIKIHSLNEICNDLKKNNINYKLEPNSFVYHPKWIIIE
jgi:hypothetical protein